LHIPEPIELNEDHLGEFETRTCFVAGTLVARVSPITLKEELVPIEQIKVGDKVYSFNEKTHSKEVKPVTELFYHEVELLFRITLEDGSLIETTWNHPFYVTDATDKSKTHHTGGWVEAKNLKSGDRLLLSNGSIVVIDSVVESPLSNPVAVYNFEVEDNHSYFVGDDGVLVHNYIDLAIEAVSISLDIMDFKESYDKGDKWGMAMAGGSLIIDGIAAAVPFVPGGVGIARKAGKKVVGEVVEQTTKKGVKEGGEEFAEEIAEEAVEQGVQKGKKKIDQAALARGRKNEAKALAEEGLRKNTESFTIKDPKTGKLKTTIPDGMKNGQTVEIKDVKTLSDSAQLRVQNELSGQNGKRAKIITGKNTKVSDIVLKN
jgi:intein/homing endonuclease